MIGVLLTQMEGMAAPADRPVRPRPDPGPAAPPAPRLHFLGNTSKTGVRLRCSVIRLFGLEDGVREVTLGRSFKDLQAATLKPIVADIVVPPKSIRRRHL